MMNSNFNKHETMSEKRNAKRSAYQKKQEQEGKKVIYWILGVLIVLTIIYLIWTFSIMS